MRIDYKDIDNATILLLLVLTLYFYSIQHNMSYVCNCSCSKKSVLLRRLFVVTCLVLVVALAGVAWDRVEIEAIATVLGGLSNRTKCNSSRAIIPEPMNITDEWIRDCVDELSQIETGPFHTLRPEYALGDCIKLCDRCDWHGENDITTTTFFPNWTMAGSYGLLACPHRKRTDEPKYKHIHGGNLEVVEEVLERFGTLPGYERPDPDAILLHLRLGDVIEWSNNTVLEMLTQGGNPAHHKNFHASIKSIHEYLENIRQANVTKVIIVGGSHRPLWYRKSRVYAGCLDKALRRAGLEVNMSLDGGDADKEFYYMAHAKKVVVSAGGYSKLIGKMVERFGGKRYGRAF